MSPELRSRLVLGPLLALIAIAAIAWDLASGNHYGTLALGALVTITAPREFARLARHLAPGVQTMPIVVGAVALVLVAWPGPEALGLPPGLPYSTIVISLALLWVCLRQMASHGLADFTANVGATILGLVYLGVAMQLLFQLAVLGEEEGMRGTKLLILTLVACKMGDVFAFAGGKCFGRHKLAPSISPGKTWEGFLASLVGSIGGTYGMVALLALAAPHLPAAAGHPSFDAWWHPMIWGVVLGPAGVLGDLVESCLKRQAGVKDSGSGLAGFGGYLDVFDAILIAAPVACVLALALAL